MMRGVSDHAGLLRRGALGLILAFLATLVYAGPAAGLQGERDIDCSLPPTGKVPLTDLGSDTYLGAQGGLYPEGSNSVPDSHLAVGLRRAAQIQPLDESGEPDPDGAIGFASIGFSNPQREFQEFEPLVPQTPNFVPEFRAVNLAQGGQHILTWASPGSRPWENVPEFLDRAGVTAEQIQGVWLKQVVRNGTAPDMPFPESAAFFRDKLIEVVTLLQEEFPNLQVIYLSSRVYGGWNNVSSPSPEPDAYEEGFGVKWLIEEQIAGNPLLNADPEAGAVVAPWLAWGPYLWADGTNPRSDGLTWACNEFRASDGAHLDGGGNLKVANMLLAFLQTEPTAAWAFSDRELPATPRDAVPPPTSTIPGQGDASTATTEPPTDEEQRREERRNRQRARDTTTTNPSNGAEDGSSLPSDPPPTDPTAAARPEADGRGRPSPIVWALIGAAATLVVVAAGAMLYRMRHRDREGSAPPGPEV